MNATPPQGIDRDALWASTLSAARVAGDGRNYQRRSFDAGVEATLNALVRPVEGVTLTPEEAHEALAWIEVENDQTRALIAKLRSGDPS